MIVRHVVLAIAAGLFGLGGTAAAEQTFKDCSDCPLLVNLPAGSLMMGASAVETKREAAKDDERPQHSVTISRNVAIGRYAVTRGEFAAFVRETGYDPTGCYVYTGGKWVNDRNGSWRNPGFEQTDRHPVVCVSFEDAQRYVQ